MQNVRLRERNWTKVIAYAACALSVALIALNFAQMQRIRLLSAKVSAVYQKAFYETCELMEGMSADLSKLLIAGSYSQEQQLLNDIARSAQGAENNLGLLPLGENAVSGAMKFLNQTGDFSTSLSARLAAGGAVSRDDHELISTLSINAAELSLGLSRLLVRFEAGETLFSADIAADEGDYSPLTKPAADYPALLYDGPFSDGSAGNEFKALSGLQEIDSAEAQSRLHAFLGAGAVTASTLEGESNIPIPCYEFSVTANGYSLSAGITRAGGEVLYLLINDDITDANLSDTQAIEAAQAFLISRGYGAMEMSYYSRYDGIMTINFAAVQNSVILYPDLIKVQVSLKDGNIVGFEANNYLKNHVSRTIELPSVTEEEAISRLSESLTAKSSRLCVIPENTSEYLCYEISATNENGSYLIYIDAITGHEREIMQIISDENGVLVM